MRRLNVTLAVAFVISLSLSTTRGEQPKIGFEGEIVDLPSQYEGAKGYRITDVYRGTHAHRARLEPGDTIVYINNMSFQNEAAYDYAISQVGEVAWIGFINVRNNRLTWFKARFGHEPHGGPAPPGFAYVEFAPTAVITIYNKTSIHLSYQLRTMDRDGHWSDWRSHRHEYPNGGYHWHTFSNVERIQIRFDCIAGDDDFTEKVFNLPFNSVTPPGKIDEDDGRPYYFQFDAGGQLLHLYKMRP